MGAATVWWQMIPKGKVYTPSTAKAFGNAPPKTRKVRATNWSKDD